MTDQPTIYVALAAVMADVGAVKKIDENKQQNYRFRGIDGVINAVGPVLRKHGVIAVPHESEAHYRDVQTSTGKPSRECTVKVTYRFYGPAGDFIPVTVPGESMDFGDKGAPKAMSVAYRIALLQALCIPTDDIDPDSTSYERAPQPVPRPVPEVSPLNMAKKRVWDASMLSEPNLHSDERVAWVQGEATTRGLDATSTADMNKLADELAALPPAGKDPWAAPKGAGA